LPVYARLTIRRSEVQPVRSLLAVLLSVGLVLTAATAQAGWLEDLLGIGKKKDGAATESAR